MDYEPKTYWERRLAHNLGLVSVGHAGLGFIYNSWLYKARFRAMRRALKRLKVQISGRRIVELGVGSGAWLPFWQAYGPAHIVGVDITDTSVKNLSGQYPHFSFLRADICAPKSCSEIAQVDIVTAFDVLFHVTDDTAFSHAVANMADLTKPNGWVIFSDSVCDTARGPSYHEYHRSCRQYQDVFSQNGLHILDMVPIFFTMTTTLCSDRARLLQSLTSWYLRWVARVAARPRIEWINHLVGCSLYLLDGFLGLVLRNGPSLKLVFAKKCFE